MSIFGDTVPQVIMIFGAPGAGKGTVGQILCKVGNHFHLSSGDIFRNLDPESESGKLFKSYSTKGQLVPDELTLEICTSYIKTLIDTKQYFPTKQMLLLDGLPRTVSQAEILNKSINVKHIIVLDIKDEQELIDRLSKRAKIEGRPDDANVDIIQKRIEEYHAKTAAVLDFYPKEIVHHYNASQTPIEVLRDVLVGSAESLIIKG